MLCNAPNVVDSELSLEENEVPGLDTLGYCYSVKMLSLNLKYFLVDSPPGDIPIDFIKGDLSRYVNNYTNSYEQISIQDIYSYILSEYSSYISGIDSSESFAEFSIFLPNGVTLHYAISDSTSFSSSTTKPYYLTKVGGIESRVYDFLPSLYLENLQVGDSTCSVYLDKSKISMSQV